MTIWRYVSRISFPSIIASLLAAILLSVPLCGCQSTVERTTVTQVLDGDTIVTADGQHVRYIGIDTPEVHPVPDAFGIEAWQANREMVEGKIVHLEQDVSNTDQYGRLLRYVYVDDILVNAELVRLGLARAKPYPPDTKYSDYLEKMETEAMKAGRGMWAK